MKCSLFVGESFEAKWVKEGSVSLEQGAKYAVNKKTKVRTVACNFGI
jgi:hypothetical protein